MRKLPQPKHLERATGSLVADSTLTVVAALAGGPLVALLPVLSKSLAAGRQRERVETAVLEVQAILIEHEAQLMALTDEQYKLINESILAMLATTQAEKLTLLRNAVKNTLSTSDFNPQESVVLSRVIRDISVQEVNFLLVAFAYQGVELTRSAKGEISDNTILQVNPDSNNALNVAGFVSLGLLSPSESNVGSLGVLRFTRIAAKVLALLRADV